MNIVIKYEDVNKALEVIELHKDKLIELGLRDSILCLVDVIIQQQQEYGWLKEDKNRFKAFYDYFAELYGQDLQVVNWHLNGELESFDNFFESAEESMIETDKKF